MVSELCCGVVSVVLGSPLKFCVNSARVCAIKGHMKAKHLVSGYAFYVQASPKSAYLTPSLMRASLSLVDGNYCPSV